MIRRLLGLAALLACALSANVTARADTSVLNLNQAAALQGTETVLTVQTIGGVKTLVQTPLSSIRQNFAPPSMSAPPSVGTYSVGTIIYNSSPATGAPLGWVNVQAGTPGLWAPIATIGTALATPAPAQYTVSVLSPASGATVTGITQFSVQAPGMLNVELWDSTNKKLAGGAPAGTSGLVTLSYDTNGLPNGPNSLSVNAWDVAAWINGGASPDQQPTHSASAPLSLTVANNATGTPALTSITVAGLGDSITAGQGGAGLSYRPELKTKLAQSGITVTYVGTQSDGTYSHDGYPGKGVDDLIDKVNASPSILASNPNVVVVEIGTNDNSGYSGAKNAPAYASYTSGGTSALLTRMGVLLDAIHGKVPNAYIVVSNLLPRTGSMAVDESGFNAGVGSVISARSSSSYHVYLVDDSSNFPSSTGLADGLHPNDTVGYPWLGDQIAGVVGNALKSSGGGGSTSPPPSSTITAPPAAVAAGFTNLVFDDEMDSISTFDVNGTRAAGFKWYFDRPFGWSALSGSCVSVQNGYATIKCDGTGPNYSIATVGSSGSSWQGFAQGGGAYFEARIRFNASTRGSTGGWPSFWTMSAEHLFGGNGTRWFESDFMEFLMWNFGGSATAYGATTHDWPGGTQDLHTAEGASDGNWHVFGAAWKPATATPNSGYVKYYLDGNLIGTTTWSQGGTYSVGDAHHMPVILGTDTNWPMDVDYVRVWH